METESSTPAPRRPLSVGRQVQNCGLSLTAGLEVSLSRKSAAAVLAALKPEGTTRNPSLLERARNTPALQLYLEDFSEEACRRMDVDRMPKLIAMAGLSDGDEQEIERAENEGWPHKETFGPVFFWEVVGCRA